ncbi:MAG: Gfo/Idh/MocA family oxidoreductase [Ruminococcaceae bacterium]|nr:Gfo/Idh/MocA family oxidoreductase [Oscillospiraceae bacterium]
MADKSMQGLNNFSAEETRTVDTAKKMRVGIIGCGWIADSHMKAYLKQPDVEIVAGADLIEGKAEAFMAKYGVTGAKTHYKNDREMIDDKSLALDAVSICTYNRQHAEPAIYALKNGVNVLLEKPFTVTLDEAIEVMKAEKESGKVLSIGHQPRFDANMKKIKEIVESGELGQIYYIQTGGGRRRGIPTPFGTTFIEKDTAGVGALGDIGCYSLDMVLNAIGNPKPLTVSGYKSNFFGKDPNYVGYKKDKRAEYAEKFGVDDFAAAFIRLEGGIILDFRIAWAMNLDTSGDTIIMGTKGSLRIPSTECWNGTVGGAMKIYHEMAGSQVETEIPVITMKEGLFDLKIRTFLDACKNGTEAPVPSSSVLYNQAIIDGIARSAELGREVEIVIPEI